MEIFALQKLKGVPGIIQILDHGEEQFEAKVCKFIVFEYVEGCTLYKIMEQGRLSVNLAKQIFLSLFKIVCQIHNMGIVHRDLKLDNFMVRANGHLVLIDFGFAAPIHGKT